jgi:hypothetical protein
MSQSSESQVLLEILKKRGIVSNSLVKSVQGFMSRWNVDAYRAVVETHTVEESKLADILSEEFQMTRITRLRSRPVDKEALKYVAYSDAMASDLIPYAIDQDGHLHVAIADPTRKDCIVKLSAKYGKPLVLHIAERLEIESSIQRHYPLSMQLPNTMSGIKLEGCNDESKA